MAASPAFSKRFSEFYAIHETIHAILSEPNGDRMDANYVVRRVRGKHPGIEMSPATLIDAIKQAMKDHAATDRLT